MLEESRRFTATGSSIFIVSDFHDLDDDCERHLFELARHGNINFCHVYDQIEAVLPDPSIYAVSDGQQQTMLDTGNSELRQRFEKAFEDRSQRLKKLSEKFSAGLLSFSTADNVMSVLGRAYSKKRSNARNSNTSTSGGD